MVLHGVTKCCIVEFPATVAMLGHCPTVRQPSHDAPLDDRRDAVHHNV